MLVSVEDMALRQVAAPYSCCLVVALESFGGSALEYCGIQAFGIQPENFDKIFPGHIDGLFLEVVAEGPVSEHLEHSVVVGIVPHLFKVVVLTAYSQALLRVGNTLPRWRFLTQNNVLELVHTGIGEHQGWVVLDYHRRRRHDMVVF